MSKKRKIEEVKDIRKWAESELRKTEEIERRLFSPSNSKKGLPQEKPINIHDILFKHIAQRLEKPNINLDQYKECFSSLKKEISQPAALGSQLTERIEKARKQRYRKAFDMYSEIASSIEIQLEECEEKLQSLERSIDRDVKSLKDYEERLKQLIEIEKACGDSDIVTFLDNELTWAQDTLSELSSLRNKVNRQLQKIGKILKVFRQRYYGYY
mgnify:CR=1 FL=1